MYIAIIEMKTRRVLEIANSFRAASYAIGDYEDRGVPCRRYPCSEVEVEAYAEGKEITAITEHVIKEDENCIQYETKRTRFEIS